MNLTPHMTFVHGDDNIAFLKRRWEIMKKSPCFADMEFSDDFNKIKQWAPLLCTGRDPNGEKIACTYVNQGTDVDFGALTKGLFKGFTDQGGTLLVYHTVTNMKKEGDKWRVTVRKDDLGKGTSDVLTKFVFVGGGGNSLPVLQNAGIPEIRGFGGFPISGQFLVCQNPDIVNQHKAKIY